MISFQSILIAMIFCAFIDVIFDSLLIKYECKKIKYDCNKCRNIKCYYHYCNKKRNELNK